MRQSFRVICGIVLALLCSRASQANYQSICAGCHQPVNSNEVNSLPNGSSLSGSIRAANNLAYLNFKIANGMGGLGGLSATERSNIAAEIGASLSVAAPVITSGAPPNAIVNAAYSFSVTATGAPTPAGNPGLDRRNSATLTDAFSVIAGALPPGLALDGNSGQIGGTPTVPGTYTGTIRVTNLIGSPASQAFSITVSKLDQTVSFNTTPMPVYSPGGTFSVSASASSGLPVGYGASGNCTVNAGSGLVTITGAGFCGITATQAGDATFNSASADQFLSIAKADQTISFGAQTPATQPFSAGSFALNPAATGGPRVGAITYATNDAQICTVSGSTVSVGSVAGACIITATQNGDANYNSISATQNIALTATKPGPPTIISATPGNGLAVITFTPPANNGGSPITGYTVSCSSVIVNGSSSPIVVTGLTNGTTYPCAVSAKNAFGSTPSNVKSVTPTIGATPPAFTSADNATFVVATAGAFNVTASGTPAPTLALTGTLPPAVGFNPTTGALSGTPQSGTAGVYPLMLTATGNQPPGVTQAFTLTVGKKTQTITFPAIAPQTLEVFPFFFPIPLPASASSGLNVAYASTTPSVCTVSGGLATKVSAGTCTITADQPGNQNFLPAARVTQSFAISAANTAAGQARFFVQNIDLGFFGGLKSCADCHTATDFFFGTQPSGSVLNAANAGNVIQYAFGAGSNFSHSFNTVPLTAQDLTDLAAYLGAYSPGNANFYANYNAASAIPLPRLQFGSVAGTPAMFDAVTLVTPPTRGMVSFAMSTDPLRPNTMLATYTPFSGESGADLFSYRATGPAGQSQLFTMGVVLDSGRNPFITSPGSASGVAGMPFSFQASGGSFPTLFGLSPPQALQDLGLHINADTGLIFGTPNAAGTFAFTLNIANSRNADAAPLTITIASPTLSVARAGTGGGTVISNPAGINCGASCTAPFNVNTAITLTANAAPGSSFTGWAGAGCNGTGACVVQMNGNQAVTASFSAGIVPDAPTAVSATTGDGAITLRFTAPVNGGSAPILNFPIDCGSVTATATASPFVLTGLANGTPYTCSVRAANSVGAGPPSATVTATPQRALALTALFSRKTHGAAGVFNLPLLDTAPADGGANIEPRAIGNGIQIVFRFDQTITNPGAVTAIRTADGMAVLATAQAVGNEVIVALTGAADRGAYRIALQNVDGTVFGGAVNVAFLQGDVNASRAVNAADISAIKARVGRTVDDSNFRLDINADGSLNQADVTTAKTRSGAALP